MVILYEGGRVLLIWNLKYERTFKRLSYTSNTPTLWKVEQTFLGEGQKYILSKAETGVEGALEKHVFILQKGKN